MRKLMAFVLVAAVACGGAQVARGAQSGDGRTPTGKSPAAAATGRGSRTKPPRINTPPPPPPPSARLIVHVNQPGSIVEFDGREVGSTDGRGYLHLPPATNGQHTLVVRKSGYYEHRQVVELVSGPNGTLEIKLPPRPGRLSITPNVPGARVYVEGLGSYNGSVEGVELAPGSYRVTVTKLGYAPFAQEVTVAPGMSNNVALTLVRLSAKELLSQAETEFQAGRYAQAITLGEMALPELHSDPRLTMLLGLSHFALNNLQASLGYFQQVVAQGQSLTLNVKHFHKLKKGEGFCQGTLVLRRGALEFRSSENPAESFAVPFVKVVGMRPDPDRGGRVSMQVWLPDPKSKKRKEKGFDYSFHPAQAYLRNKDPRKQNSPMLADCSGCQPMAQFIYQLIQQAGR